MNPSSKTLIGAMLLLVLNSPLYAQLTIEACQEKARNNYPLIRQFDLIEQTKEYTLSNAGKSYLPQLDITLIGGVISGLPSFSPSGSSSTEFNVISVLQFNQLLWDGGITKSRKGMIEAQSEIEKANLEVSLFALEDRVNNLFFGVLLIDEQLRQLEILKSTLTRNKQRIEVAIANGTAFRSDLDELQVEIIRSDQRVVELSYNREVYISLLAAMMGEPIDGTITLRAPEVERGASVLENNRPELTMFEQQTNVISAQRTLEKSILNPKIGLLGFGTFIQPGVEFGSSDLTNVLVGGLSVNWSLGGLYSNGNNKKLMEINLQKVALQKETFLFNNHLETEQARLQLKKYEALIDQDKEIVALKTRIKEAYSTKYDNGISTMSELLDRTNEESIARQNLLTHEVQYLMHVYQYKNKTGN